ncbi:MAG: sulfatase [Verrucomicrobiota bacterium]
MPTTIVLPSAILCSFLAIALGGLAKAQSDVEERPNVLFIAIDDLNDTVGFLRAHPGVKTPNLDRLAARGVSFTNAHCAAPACAPSRTAVITGMRPSSSGIYLNGHNALTHDLTKDLTTLPKSFQEAGYLTKGGGKIYHAHTLSEAALEGFLDPEPWDSFFPSKSQQLPAEVTPSGDWPVNGNGDWYRGRFDWEALDVDDDEMADAKVVSWAEKELSKVHEKPLFLAVGIYRPHIPWWTPKRYFDLHPLSEIALPEVEFDDLDDVPPAGRDFPREHWQKWIEENGQWANAVQGYFASVSFTDAMVGRLMAALDNGPLSRNTIVVLWSDHGYHLGQKQHWEKFALWEQATHVPLIFADTREDGFGKGETHVAASLLDIYPTLAELCQLDPPSHLDGESLVPWLEEPEREEQRAVVTTHGFQNHAVKSERWRYIRYADGSEELYDHQSDPNEFVNVAGRADLVGIKAELASWLPERNVESAERDKKNQK